MHRNAPLTPEGRRRLCQRIEAGWPVAHAAESMHISRDRAYVWWRRYQSEGVAGLQDRSSRPHRSPARTKATKERRIVGLRTKRGLGPARIAGIVGLPASTVHRVLVRHRLNRLDHLDRATRAPIRRIEMTRPGELVHIDVKKLGRIPRGGGWRVHGKAAMRGQHHHTKVGYAFVHSAWTGSVVSPTPRCSPTSRPSPRRPFGDARMPFSPSSASSLSGSSPTTAAVIEAVSSPAHSGRSNTASPGPTDPRPTARSNGSTAPCWPSGLTRARGPQRADESVPLCAGCTSTNITDTTPRSVARPCTASAT